MQWNKKVLCKILHFPPRQWLKKTQFRKVKVRIKRNPDQSQVAKRALKNLWAGMKILIFFGFFPLLASSKHPRENVTPMLHSYSTSSNSFDIFKNPYPPSHYLKYVIQVLIPLYCIYHVLFKKRRQKMICL